MYLKKSLSIGVGMSYECRYLDETFCNKRLKECDPGSPGCVLRGRFVFGIKENRPSKKETSVQKKETKEKKAR